MKEKVKEEKLTTKEMVRRFDALRELDLIGKEPQVVGELEKSGIIEKGVAHLSGRYRIRLEGARVLIGENGGGTRIDVFGYDGKTVETLESDVFIEGVVMRE